MLPNAFASYYIKRGWNVWITDFYIKLGFKPGHTQWPDLMCVFFFKGREFMKIIALNICWNSWYGQLNTERERSCTNMCWAIKWRMWIPYLEFKNKLSCMFHNTIHHQIKDTSVFYVWKCIFICQGKHDFLKCLNSELF